MNKELNYGFIKSPKLGDVFFSEETSFSGTDFDQLKVDQKVFIDVIETERGLFAKSVGLKETTTPSKRPPEASL